MELKVKFKEITVLNDKLKWFKLFQKSYSGGCKDPDISDLTDGSQRFIVAVENNQQLGFVQISNRESWTGVKGLWSVDIAYVKPESRNKKVLKNLISYVVKNYGVGIIHIEEDRFYKNNIYYKSLGFTDIEPTGDGLSYIYIKKAISKINKVRRSKSKEKVDIPRFMNFVYDSLPFGVSSNQPRKAFGF